MDEHHQLQQPAPSDDRCRRAAPQGRQYPDCGQGTTRSKETPTQRMTKRTQCSDAKSIEISRTSHTSESQPWAGRNLRSKPKTPRRRKKRPLGRRSRPKETSRCVAALFGKKLKMKLSYLRLPTSSSAVGGGCKGLFLGRRICCEGSGGGCEAGSKESSGGRRRRRTELRWSCQERSRDEEMSELQEDVRWPAYRHYKCLQSGSRTCLDLLGWRVSFWRPLAMTGVSPPAQVRSSQGLHLLDFSGLARATRLLTAPGCLCGWRAAGSARNDGNVRSADFASTAQRSGGAYTSGASQVARGRTSLFGALLCGVYCSPASEGSELDIRPSSSMELNSCVWRAVSDEQSLQPEAEHPPTRLMTQTRAWGVDRTCGKQQQQQPPACSRALISRRSRQERRGSRRHP